MRYFYNFLRNFYSLGIYCIIFIFVSCSSNGSIEDIDIINEPEPITYNTSQISSSNQRKGDIEKGKEYLFSGNFMSSGIPYSAYILANGEDNSNLLNRTGDNAVIAHDYTALTAPNGVRVVAPNCLNCHSSKINDTFIIGLGNHSSNFTNNRAEAIPLLDLAINRLYGINSEEEKATELFKKSITAIGPKTVAKNRGVNVANKIAEVLISHRDKNTLEWIDAPNVNLPDEVIPTDVPAWWLLKKKNAMFHNAMGREDFCKSFIGASLLTLADVNKAIEVDENMVDVLAYIYSLEAPEYPFEINTNLANEGKIIFNNNCVTCHGTYGDNSSYPNLLVSLETINTDSELSNHYTTTSINNDYFLDWFNTGWFGTSENPLQLVPEGGYIAPPLDGIWASAPYFHNGSVPTVEDVLNSTERPTFWSRTFDNTDYNKNKLGWNYSVETNQSNINTYNTTLKGYTNGGHTFGDKLSDEERKALIEYLKTL